MDGMELMKPPVSPFWAHHVLDHPRKLEFNEGDIGLAGGIQAPFHGETVILIEPSIRNVCIPRRHMFLCLYTSPRKSKGPKT